MVFQHSGSVRVSVNRYLLSIPTWPSCPAQSTSYLKLNGFSGLACIQNLFEHGFIFKLLNGQLNPGLSLGSCFILTVYVQPYVQSHM